jgi:hypothetical protein
MWRHIAALARAQRPNTRISTRTTSRAIDTIRRRAILAHRSHSLLKRTSGREMLPVADTTLDLLILQLVLDAADLGLLLLRVLAPVHRRLEDDVFAHGGRVQRWSGLVLRGKTEFREVFSLGDARVDDFFVDGGADAAGRLDLLAVVVVAPGYDRFGAIFVGGDLLRGEILRLIEIFVVGPVLAAVHCG